MNDVIPEQRIARELTSGEHLLWSGRPRQGLFFRANDAFMIPFSLLWCGFALFWEGTVLTSDAPWFFKLWGIPFVLVGLYMVFGRFVVDIRQRRFTVYGVTSSRVIIVTKLLTESVQSIRLHGLSDISLSEKADGSGNVVLGPTSISNAFAASGWSRSGQNPSPTLEGIPQARVVHDLIRHAQHGSA